MIYDTGEYNVTLDIPSDNFVVHNFTSRHTEYMWDYLPEVRKSITNDTMLVILFGAFHNIHEYDHWFTPINELCDQIPNNIIVFTGKLTPDYWVKVIPKFAYHRVSIFDHISNTFWKENLANRPYEWENITSERTHKFYWASSKDWYTRRYILAGLIKNDLLNGNLVNYKCITSNIPSDQLNARFRHDSHSEIIKECESIQHLIPLPSIDNTIEFNQTNRNFYLNSYVGLVTDTFFDSGVFLSEKVFNAMHHHQLFFYIGSAHSLQYLRNQGYDTFDNVIDTSYDTIEDNADRLFAARASLIKFLQQPIDKLHRDYVQCMTGIQNNKRLLLQQKPDTTITQVIGKLLNEH